MQAAVIQHVPFEGPALIARALVAAGAEVRVVRADRGEELPDATELDVLVVLGGPMSASDETLAGERELIAACVGLGRPVLGVCLGAQLLAAALRAEVRRGPEAEAGTGSVRLVADDPVLGAAGTELPVLHWHEDTFDLPETGVLLASSARYPNQAFRSGASYGFQFHVEFDAGALDRAAPHLPAGTIVEPAAARAAAAAGTGILRRWAEHAVGSAR
ncbi:type 1 glutamine amidotransferase [Kribbella sp. C-35]|uniref:type 1 glutamine amidotransferase n=1 Tax=Kribbella sp. C-35 TaxID=2789276 RepID=UPI003978F415